jgi:hypothetical protein
VQDEFVSRRPVYPTVGETTKSTSILCNGPSEFTGNWLTSGGASPTQTMNSAAESVFLSKPVRAPKQSRGESPPVEFSQADAERPDVNPTTTCWQEPSRIGIWNGSEVSLDGKRPNILGNPRPQNTASDTRESRKTSGILK